MYGCDICQDICPKNKGKWIEVEDFPQLDEIKELLTLEQILTMDDKILLEVLLPRFSYISEDRIWLWKCNAIRAMVNSGDKKFFQYIKNACSSNNDKIKDMAFWACKRLGI
jgi:epoxyqueuosine reductase